MKLAYLANGLSIHTVRWVNEMALRGHDVHLISMNKSKDPLHTSIKFHKLHGKPPLGYFFNIFFVKIILKNIAPDLLHIHYASGYGMLGSLSGFHPRIVSVWGSDVYDFPNSFLMAYRLIDFVLQSADYICSTSQTMADYTAKKFLNIPNIMITPFGIDSNQFKPDPNKNNRHEITIGTVKTLDPKYAIDVLIRAFAMAKKKLKNDMRLLIVGEGPQRRELEDIASQSGVKECTIFTGSIAHADVPQYLNSMDIYAAVSRCDSESFGVAVLEASSCGLPVVVSSVGGLSEVVEKGITGFIVEKDNIEETTEAIIRLVQDPILCKQMGEAGRQRVINLYEWEKCADRMESVYKYVQGEKNAF